MHKLVTILLFLLLCFNYWNCATETINKNVHKIDSSNNKKKEAVTPIKVKKDNLSNGILIWLLAILFICFLVLVFLSFKKERMLNTEGMQDANLNEAKSIIRELNKELQISQKSNIAQQEEIEFLKKLINNTAKKPKDLGNKQEGLIVGQQLPVQNNKANYIKAEILISAGPRKNTSNNNDTELGEDVAGIISLPNQIMFWLLDGTSDSTIINSLKTDSKKEISHLFSSRLLAQNFAYYLKRNIASYSPDKFSDLLIEAQKYLIVEWTKRINNVSKEKKEEILNIITQGFQPLCSTTIILGSFQINGELYALRTGDSKVLPFIKNEKGDKILDKRFELSKDPTSENDRIAFRLDYDTNNSQFSIRSNNFRSLAQSLKDISTVHIFSDGIGRAVETQLSSDKYGVVDKIEENIARLQQKTFDDKSLIILERIIT